ncbi:MAG: monovalent cation/H+ antiporter complex subunit F [Dysgonamonadaceae bacterium]|jgi:multicomponent Na+:H+ antiporter subunit F|nr:monovalent cation/H+ antiporter complex subunit F [Dysgonamonadaceae bacterium]MDD3356054.1 monovalent cation/H+ antiporter complex subunit F [Dysgonamonadaceae bacterium]MDD3728286.1 monovalent cation/H+ antiporter complex subunit F [Dysgonamonadaceae bacterium]MDD4246452.1 monovalent cation/H+ antiporter complex subunit F [Dysgonamonadaceae bacterium]MDD4605319.1 monovalent cation/H+ antiporter complex subunit F [Dysgonamonadaceae bacterium]
MELPFYNLILILTSTMLLIAFALAFARIVKGPTPRDRIVALDLIASITMGFILVYSVVINKAMYFDIVIVISLISFIGTVAMSTYLKQK